jgi:IS1 family transposase
MLDRPTIAPQSTRRMAIPTEELDRLTLHLIIGLLVEGMGIRPMERALAPLAVGRSAISRLGFEVGQACVTLLNARLRNLSCGSLQLDEMHAYIRKRDPYTEDALDWPGREETPPDPKDYFGAAWTYLAIDPDTKLIVSYIIGKHTRANTVAFLQDIKGRVVKTPILATDGLPEYKPAIASVFGKINVHYGIIKKRVEKIRGKNGKMRKVVVGIDRKIIFGNPPQEKISTSIVERVNREVRAHLRRNTRRTPSFSKALEYHTAAAALFIAYYNFCLRHRSLRGKTPAMAAGLQEKPWTIGDLCNAAMAIQLFGKVI